MVMFDSLNRRFLEPYGCEFNRTPHFRRLAERTAQFNRFYSASLPCMPARRDIHTGRYSFLHRGWGAVEPFDNSMPEILKHNGIYSRLVSDHYHYWEDGGATYHSRYSSWEAVRGQEADQWADQSAAPDIPEHVPTMREVTHPEWWTTNWKNRERYRRENAWPIEKTFDLGLQFLERNADQDNWFLQIETFCPHEPFDSPDELRHFNGDSYSGPVFDWPPYAPVSESPELVEHMRSRYAASLHMCDQNLGRVLDFMDAHDLWKDTMLIVNTDHGFMLGEKDWWAKSVMPCYNEVANIPFFIWDPRAGVRGVQREALCQTIDIPATVLDFFGIDRPAEMQGKSLMPAIVDDAPLRQFAMYGYFGSFVNVTDGKHTYMRSSASVGNTPLHEYTCIAVHQQGMFSPQELSKAEIAGPFAFSKGARMLKVPVPNKLHNATFCNSFQYGNLLFDLESDPEQLHPLEDPETEAELINELLRLMKENEAPAEQYERLGLVPELRYTARDVERERTQRVKFEDMPISAEFSWTDEAKRIFIGMLALVGEDRIDEYLDKIREVMARSGQREVTRDHFAQLARCFYSDNEQKIFFFLNKLSRIR